MKEEARIFYNNASPYKPTYYWIDVEEETMSNMEEGVQAFRAELKRLGAEKIGLYIGAYFMLEQEVSTKTSMPFGFQPMVPTRATMRLCQILKSTMTFTSIRHKEAFLVSIIP